MAQITADYHPDEPDRISVRVGGVGPEALVVDVIANEDGSVYVEAYAYQSRVEGAPQSRRQVVVQHAAINRYEVQHPNLRLELATTNSPKGA